MSKYFVNQISDGNEIIIAETDNIQTAIVNYHSTCANLWNDENTEKAIVIILDENGNVVSGFGEKTFIEYNGYKEIIDKANTELNGNLFVIPIVNGNIITKDIIQSGSVKGAMVNFHQKCAAYWNAGDVAKARIAIFNDNLNLYSCKSESIIHNS